MATLREAAALLVEQGKAIGRLEQTNAAVRYVEQVAANMRDLDKSSAEALATLAQKLRDQIPQLEFLATTARVHAQELVTELEHPGAALARRLLASWHGARAAWRGTR